MTQAKEMIRVILDGGPAHGQEKTLYPSRSAICLATRSIYHRGENPAINEDGREIWTFHSMLKQRHPAEGGKADRPPALTRGTDGADAPEDQQ